MSHLSYMEKLLDGVDVEWVPLGDLGNIVTGRTPKSSDKSAWGDEVDFVTPSDIKNGMRSITHPSRRLSAEGAASMTKAQIPSGSLLVTCIGADMGKTVVNSNVCITNQQINAIILTDDSVQTGYLFHVLSAMRDTLRRQGELGGGTMPLINKSDFSKIIVPIPCPDNPEKSLAIQAEIVRILDGFNALIAELTTELNMRKKQYSHYQFELLKFTETTQQISIGECCDIKKGATPIKKATPGKFPLVATTEERQSSSEYQFDCPAVCVPLISSRGHGVASIDRIYYQDGKFALGNILCAITPNDSEVLSAKFLRYYLFDKKDVLLVPLMRGGANVSLTMDSLKKVKIPIPPIADQQRIVCALDKFDEFVKALPCEIELRQKQYEYYRDLLLSFPQSHSDEAA